MAQEDRLNKWTKIASIARPIIALIVLVLGGGFFYSEVWHVPDVTYTVLPTYDLEDIAFSGLVVENRGRRTAHNVHIILADLGNSIERLHMPGPHEKADTTWNPETPTNEAAIEMERLSPGSSLPIYLLTSGPVTLAQGETFAISSDRGNARLSSGPGSSLWLFYVILCASILGTWLYLRGAPRNRLMQSERQRGQNGL
jgi:hypothetical protein